MACTAIGSFPKEIPYECAVALLAAIKGKQPKGETLQIAAQVLGQTGALMSSKQNVGVGEDDDAELVALAEAAEAKMPAEPAEGQVAAIPWSILIPIIAPVLQKLLIDFFQKMDHT